MSVKSGVYPLITKNIAYLANNVINSNERHGIRVSDAPAPADVVDTLAQILPNCVRVAIHGQGPAQVRPGARRVRCGVKADNRGTSNGCQVRGARIRADNEVRRGQQRK